MTRFEYKVVPAPIRGEKAKGLKTTQDRFARALTSVMNRLGAEGWEYLRADTLPCEERSGFTGSKMSTQHMLIFRRVIGMDDNPAIPGEPSLEKRHGAPEDAAEPRLGRLVPPLTARSAKTTDQITE
ncbi:MAG: DUF4177 domain-containing protein [Pseudorhodobacter sp.]